MIFNTANVIMHRYKTNSKQGNKCYHFRIGGFFVALIFLTLFFCCSELIEFARKSVISRVVELTDDRTALKLEVSSLQETVSRLESRIKEREEEAKRFETFDIVIFYRNAILQC